MMRCAVQDDIQDGQLIDISTELSLTSPPFSVVHAFGPMVPARVRRFSDFIAVQTKGISGL
ncbi:hypothetical protein D3C80_2226770 [compost metagenome]